MVEDKTHARSNRTIFFGYTQQAFGLEEAQNGGGQRLEMEVWA